MEQYNNGLVPLVLIGARISGGANQKEASLEDQEDHAKEIAAAIFPGIQLEFHVCKVTVKGERLERADLSEIEAALRSGNVDLFLVEDVGRLVRGTRAKDLFCLAIEQNCRCIAINNGIDTEHRDWESKFIKQCGEEVAYNETLSNRITFKTLNRFKKHGVTARRPIVGYVVPENATTLFEWQRDNDATPIIQEGADIYLRTKNWTAVADFFNTVPYKSDVGFPVGPCCRTRTRWDGNYAANFYDNPILHGHPARQRRKNKKVHGTGVRRPFKNDAPTYIDCPHLAHLTKTVCEEIQTSRKSVNQKFARKSVEGKDPLSGISRGMSVFPGQHAKCAYCGSFFGWGANGITTSLMCCGSKCRVCWNSRGVMASVFREKLAAAISDCLLEINGFDVQYRALVQTAVNQPSLAIQSKIEQLTHARSSADRRLKNLAEAIAESGLDDQLRAKQFETRNELNVIERQLAGLDRQSRTPLTVPSTAGELQALFGSSLQRVMADDRSAALELRSLIPSITIDLVAYVDKPGFPLPRAHVVVDFAGSIPNATRVDGLPAMLRYERTIDLFEPPQRVRIMDDVVRIGGANPGLSYKEIASHIIDQGQHPTDTAVGNALKLHHCMTRLGQSSPLSRLNGPDSLAKKFKRSRHKNYQQRPPEVDA